MTLVKMCAKLLVSHQGYQQKEFDFGVGQGSRLRREFDIGLRQASKLKMSTAKECILCILMSLVKTLNIVTMGSLFMPCLFLDYFFFDLVPSLLFACTWSGIKADWVKKKNFFSFSTGWDHAIILSNYLCFL